jgi:rhodanese-related sulfurtransferase
MKKKNLALMLALTVSAVFALNTATVLAKDMTAGDFTAEALENISTISVADAKAMLDKGGVVFLDVRTKKEYRSGHVPGAIHLQRGLIEFKVEKTLTDKNATIIVYCKTGGRSSLATYTLVRMGYKNVKNMDGDWKVWAKAGYPVE